MRVDATAMILSQNNCMRQPTTKTFRKVAEWGLVPANMTMALSLQHPATFGQEQNGG